MTKLRLRPVNCAPRTCAACIKQIEGEPLELRDCSGGRVYVHDIPCALNYGRARQARFPWEKGESDGTSPD